MTITGADVLATRTQLKMSRVKFAELVGLTPTKINNIEFQRREIRPEELELLAPHVVAGSAPASTSNGVDGVVIELFDEDEELMLLELEVVGGGGAPVRPPVPPPPTHPVVVSPPSTTIAVATPAVVHDVVPASVGPVGVAALRHDGLRRLSNSELQTFKHCRRRWWLGWYRGLKLKLEKPTGALSLGDKVHRSLAEYYVPPDQPQRDPREALEAILLADEGRLILQLQSHEAERAASVMVDFKKDADLARAIIEGYVQWIAETGADQGYRVVAPEQRLTCVLRTPEGSPDIELTGKLDLRLEREHDHVRLFLDHKTCGSFERLTRLLIWDEQMKHYRVLEEENREEGEPHVEGALYNMLRKVKRSATANPPFYQRVEVRHNPNELANFRSRLIGEALAIHHVERCLEHGVDHQQVAYPSPGDRCVWGCEFSAVCPMFDDGSRAEDFITEYYDVVNPMDRYDDEMEDVT